jgi:hypothetical protein
VVTVNNGDVGIGEVSHSLEMSLREAERIVSEWPEWKQSAIRMALSSVDKARYGG